MSLKIKLLPGRTGKVIVQQISPEEKKGDLYIPENAQVKKNEGRVVMINPRTDGLESILSEGDKVLFRQHAGLPIKLDNKDYLLMTEDDIFGII